MTNLPPLNNHLPTLRSLQQAIQILRSVKLASSKVLENDLHYSVTPTEIGATTGQLGFGGELTLDYADASINFIDHDSPFTSSLLGSNQTDLANTVFKKLNQITNENFDTEKITEDNDFEFDKSAALDYSQAQFILYKSLVNFRSNLSKYKTPVVLWPHGFDLSFLWFKRGRDESKDFHMNFGFSPGFDRKEPYLYFYAWPTPPMLEKSTSIGNYEVDWTAPGVSIDYTSLKNLDIAKVLTDAFNSLSH